MHCGSPRRPRRLWDEPCGAQRPLTPGKAPLGAASRGRPNRNHEQREAVRQSHSARHWLCDLVQGP